MPPETAPRTLTCRFLNLFVEMPQSETRQVVALTLRIFLLMLAYYLLKPIREGLILQDNGAEIRSYAVALQAAILLLAMPAYSALFMRVSGERLFTYITLFFILNLLGFYLLGSGGMPIGVVFFVWLGVFSVMQIAQFWSLTVDLHNVEAGKRLFALIAVGGSLGAVLGSQIAKQLFGLLGPYPLMLLAGGILGAALLVGHGINARREQPATAPEAKLRRLLGGIALVMHDRYLRLVALFVVLLNCINSLGEFILAKVVVAQVEAALVTGADKGVAIGAFYSDFFFWVNALSLVIQLFLVSRIYRRIGIQGALLIPPLLAVLSYSVIALIPILAIIRVVKIVENSTDYSLQNTTRHALFLPLDRHGKYEGKMAIDTVFWRLGDLLQAGIVFLGASVLLLDVPHFAAASLVIALAWLGLAHWIGRHYTELTQRQAPDMPAPDIHLPDLEPTDTPPDAGDPVRPTLEPQARGNAS